MNRKKKSYAGLYAFGGILIVLIGLLIFLNTQGEESELYGGKKIADMNPATKAQLDDPNYQQIILPDELDAKETNQDNYFVYFFSSTCPHCKATTPELMPLAKDAGVNLHQYNLQEYQQGLRQYNIEYTPTLVYFENGKEKERLVGGMATENLSEGHSKEDFKAFFEKYKGSVKES
ncbi:thioredoxin family protein [Paenibacillus lemnae]|uniref:Thioredoxin n=1 Tax=Paenibacillus lemnae TaxID=1330551 RepID=A0A848M432_PAELE|nr:thioredoxin family protein [Paenibacillus lemnae]NMO95356.1 thioredoxin family protein [Paenibacillus lemnae]